MTAFGSPVVPLEKGKAARSVFGEMSIFSGKADPSSAIRLEKG